ncbi:cadherin-related tumor suppressor [Trichonephila clavipes]|uniref:Cadherin-related tumor suppressor n=1 Tax=Trichonephila clavipes TaxID=2585209 RepID=A0A8X6VMP4_TRICX|nr:cadherin-related tumor suppressor [Trichonephila clavipes]
MLQDYNPSSSRILFIRPRFSRPRFPFLPRSDLFSLVARSFSLYRVSRSTCCQVQAVDPYTVLRPCNPNPCQNDGECEVDGDNFKCMCKSPFIGETCEEGPCNPNPCQNDGKCEVDEDRFKCICKSPFIGDICKNELCSPNPCLNNGTCTHDEANFECSCVSLFTGLYAIKFSYGMKLAYRNRAVFRRNYSPVGTFGCIVYLSSLSMTMNHRSLTKS